MADVILSSAQVRILEVLKGSKGAKTRVQINEGAAKAGFATAAKFSAWMTEPLGQADAAARKQWEAKSGKKSLITLGYVKSHEVPTDGNGKETVFELSATGRAALERHYVNEKAEAKALADEEKAKAKRKADREANRLAKAAEKAAAKGKGKKANGKK